jgi:hypothetical protein
MAKAISDEQHNIVVLSRARLTRRRTITSLSRSQSKREAQQDPATDYSYGQRSHEPSPDNRIAA